MSRVKTSLTHARHRAHRQIVDRLVALKVKLWGAPFGRSALVLVVAGVCISSGLATLAVNFSRSHWAAVVLAVISSVTTAMLILGIIDRVSRP